MGAVGMGGRPGEPGAALTVWVIDSTISRADITRLCARLADLLARHEGEGTVVVCDVGGIAEPSAVTVEALARLRLTARRLGADIHVRGAHDRLRQILAFTGLDEIIPLDGGSVRESHRQVE